MTSTSQVFDILEEAYPDAAISLHFSNSWELLVAVILSAQCTDKRVNIITNSLFKKYPSVQDYADVSLEVLKEEIKSAGFYNQKAKWIHLSARKILKEFGGRVPDTMEKLTGLPGVARKTANIILYNAYNKNEGIAVDTHMKRVNYRLGLTREKTPDKIEKELTKQLPQEKWGHYSYLIIEHGRAVCRSRYPKCSDCALKALCPRKGVKKSW